MSHNQYDPTAGKQLVWSDDFSVDGPPNPAKWKYEVGMVRNHEAQYYTENRTENARVENGELVIEARKEDYKGAQYTSAALESVDSWNHGYIEVRAKVPTGKGTWPAIWMLGEARRKTGADFVPWPLVGEIDMMEQVGFDPNKIHFTIHTKADKKSTGDTTSKQVTVPNASDDWHTYGLDYQAHKLDLYFDGNKVMTYNDDGGGENTWPFDKPHFLILNLAVGGAWGGQKGIDDTIFPAKFEIKYVKVYQ